MRTCVSKLPYPEFKKSRIFYKSILLVNQVSKNYNSYKKNSFIVYFYYCKILFTLKNIGRSQRFLAFPQNFNDYIRLDLKLSSCYICHIFHQFF